MSTDFGDDLRRRGFVVLDRAVFFDDDPSFRVANEGLDAALREYVLVNDQPGADRYHLDNEAFAGFLRPWLGSPSLVRLVKDYLPVPDLVIKYIRYRQPRYGCGLQRFHFDRHPDSTGRSLELLIAFDDAHRLNGCTQIVDRRSGEVYNAEMPSGSVLVMDSAQLHRGSRNRTGEPRRMVGLQISRQPTGDDTFVCAYGREEGSAPPA